MITIIECNTVLSKVRGQLSYVNESSPDAPSLSVVGEFKGEIWAELSPLMGGGENTLLIFSF